MTSRSAPGKDNVHEILVLCFGNICRSPMMEALLQRDLDQRYGPGRFLVRGGGIGADDGRPPSQGTIRALERRGIDFRRHRSRALTRSMAESAWRIYAAEEYQIEHTRKLLREELHDRVRLFGGEEIPDPYGSNDAAYEVVAVQVERLIAAVLAQIEADLEAEEAMGPRP